MEVKASFEQHAILYYSAKLNAIRVEWKSLYMSLEKWLEIIDKAIEVGKKYNVSIWIADLYNSEGVFNQDVLDFWSVNGINKIKNNGFNYVLTVNPKSLGLTSMSDKSWKRSVKEKNPFEMVEFKNLESVEKWIQDNYEIIFN